MHSCDNTALWRSQVELRRVHHDLDLTRVMMADLRNRGPGWRQRRSRRFRAETVVANRI